MRLVCYHIARELGKYVDDVMDHLTQEEINEWAAVLSMREEHYKKPEKVEDQLFTMFGKPE